MTTPADLLKALSWRYATKAFDATKTIPAETWNVLEQSLVLAPSSYGLQPWRFIVVTNPELKAKLRPVSWGQSQVTDSSHLVVFAAKETVTEADVDHFVARTSEVRGVPVESVAGYRGMIISDIVKGPRSAHAFDWASRQAYIAFGQLMTSAAVLGVDACPLEGIDPGKYDDLLGLGGSGYKTIAACALGYRSPTDKYATLPKIRFPASEVIVHKA